MKKLYTLLLLVSTLYSSAQWVSIPDTNFGKWLKTNYAACMQGNSQVGWQMDTTCPAIVNETFVRYTGWYTTQDVTGLKYFDNLDTLFINGCQIGSLNLPAGLTFLDCHACLINSLGTLPPNLTYLDCSDNNISFFPILPATLTYFDCNYNKILQALPTLPGGLTHFNCSSNYGLDLPAMLPVGLTFLGCAGLVTTDTLPALPLTLTTLYCSGNSLDSLPALPSGLNVLWCQSNQLTSLPALPLSLDTLYCSYNQITSLPALPGSLTDLKCSGNPLPSLPALPGSLSSLEGNVCQLTSLPALPGSLTWLMCVNNQLMSLPALPSGLYYLDCTGNQLPALPNLPAGLTTLKCGANQLTSIPEMPDSLYRFECFYNPQLRCLPKLKKICIFDYSLTGLTCLPNYPQRNYSSTPRLDSLPLCDLFNQNHCPVFANLAGNVYADANLNCVHDSGEAELRNVKVQLWSGGNLQQEVTSYDWGAYLFTSTGLGNYEMRIDTTGLPFEVYCPANNVLYDTLTPIDSVHFDRDFALKCRTGFDLAVWSIQGRFRPGDTRSVNIRLGSYGNLYGFSCPNIISGMSGAVTVSISGPVNYVAPGSGALTPDSVIGNTLTYNIADYGAIDFNRSFNIRVQTDTTAQLGDTVCVTVSVTPTLGDHNPANNTLTHCFTVTNSYDPNNKEVYPLSDVDVNGERWLTYTVNFQNTGTDTAQHIYITDTLDSDLDASSFQLLAYSYQPMVQIKQNAVRFNFPNINLVDSSTNEPLSHGYVQYKVKLKNNLPIGTVINNTANIYFDFNAPVVTNTTTNTIVAPLSVSYTFTNVSCHGDNDGTIDVTPSGGTPPYTYLWNTGATVSTLANLPVGTYSVTVYDAVNNSVSAAAVISEPALLSSFTIHSDVLCYGGNNGSASITSSGGVSPYQYHWSNGSTSNQPTGLSVGNYSVTVTDANSCSFTMTVTILQPPGLNISVVQSSDTICTGETVLAVATVSGGTPPVAISWTYDFNDFYFGDSIYRSSPGVIHIIAADDNGCSHLDSSLLYACAGYVGIDNISGFQSMIVFPNPATSDLIISTNGGRVEQVLIYDLAGKLISVVNHPSNNRLDISALSSGTYIAEEKTGDVVRRARWVKM